MSDARLRTLEKVWLETGSVEAEAEFLLELTRRGDLSSARLRLAAFLGSEAAALACERPPAPAADLWGLLLGLRTFAEPALQRQALYLLLEQRRVDRTLPETLSRLLLALEPCGRELPPDPSAPGLLLAFEEEHPAPFASDFEVWEDLYYGVSWRDTDAVYVQLAGTLVRWILADDPLQAWSDEGGSEAQVDLFLRQIRRVGGNSFESLRAALQACVLARHMAR